MMAPGNAEPEQSLLLLPPEWARQANHLSLQDEAAGCGVAARSTLSFVLW
jgi:hypothetical protein